MSVYQPRKPPKKMFIIAAPVGAVPQKTNPSLARFVQSPLIDRPTGKFLFSKGWKQFSEGGLVLDIPKGAFPRIEHEKIEALATKADKQKLVLALGEQGWTFDTDRDLFWPYDGGASYLKPELVTRISQSPTLTERLKESGWEYASQGWWRTGPMFTPHVPVDVESIVIDGMKCAVEGAAIVHFHTREEVDLSYKLAGFSIDISSQQNKIREQDFRVISEEFVDALPATIINYTTSSRGNKLTSASPERYIHLSMMPDIASISFGGVFFSTGGGYFNEPNFLDGLCLEMKEYKVRPEVEIFSRTQLANILDGFGGRFPQEGHELDRMRILGLGTPQMLMLVAGVDQSSEYREPGKTNGVDDSLIPEKAAAGIRKNIEEATPEGREKAIKETITHLGPIVDKLREGYPRAKISILMSGIMQSMIVDVALGLGVDGIRVGLEDASNVVDPSVPGGVRKAESSSEQVKWVKSELISRGVKLYSAEELRRELNLREHFSYVDPQVRWLEWAKEAHDEHERQGCEVMARCMSGAKCQFDWRLLEFAQKEILMSKNSELSLALARDVNRLKRYRKLELS